MRNLPKLRKPTKSMTNMLMLMLQKLGNAYYFKADLDNAAKWYSELFAFTQDVEPEYYYRYAQSLKAIKDYKKADQMLEI